MIRVRQVKIKLGEEDNLENEVAKKLHVKVSEIFNISIVKKSLDARKKDDIHYVYEVDVQVASSASVLKKCKSKDVFLAPREEYQVPAMGKEVLSNRPIIVGSGPCGLMCAYMLAQEGYFPIVIERGEKIEDRAISVSKFWESGCLHPNSNVQFGEGGAGSFSDGKLNTMVKDKFFRGKKLFSILVEHGAPPEIMYLQKPHIGTDLLQDVVRNIRNSIIRMGGEFRYSACLTDLFIQDGKLVGIEINGKEQICCSLLVLAIGHSARDTFSMLYRRGVEMQAKPFAVGVRIQHPQSMIQMSQYGTMDSRLPVADYKLTYTTKRGRGVYSFCMCPGGFVVNASSEEGKLAINGMSYHARDSKVANSALVVSVSPDDFGSHPLDGVYFQQDLEQKAFLYGSGKIPVQLYDDFRSGIFSTQFGDFFPAMKGDYAFGDLNAILPAFIADSISEAMPVFGQKIAGFDRGDAILAGVESRTSSPIRIYRDEKGEANILGIYPAGEGSGYAGGITTAGMDGIKVAEWIIQRFRSLQSNQ